MSLIGEGVGFARATFSLCCSLFRYQMSLRRSPRSPPPTSRGERRHKKNTFSCLRSASAFAPHHQTTLTSHPRTTHSATTSSLSWSSPKLCILGLHQVYGERAHTHVRTDARCAHRGMGTRGRAKRAPSERALASFLTNSAAASSWSGAAQPRPPRPDCAARRRSAHVHSACPSRGRTRCAPSPPPTFPTRFPW